MMVRTKGYEFLAAIFFASIFQAGAVNAAEVEQATMLNDFTCKDMMRMSGEDRTIAIAVFHGYALGKKGASSYIPNDLANVTDNFIEFCLDNPKSKALDSFTKIAE